jgi:hypothetical protein
MLFKRQTTRGDDIQKQHMSEILKISLITFYVGLAVQHEICV